MAFSLETLARLNCEQLEYLQLEYHHDLDLLQKEHAAEAGNVCQRGKGLAWAVTRRLWIVGRWGTDECRNWAAWAALDEQTSNLKAYLHYTCTYTYQLLIVSPKMLGMPGNTQAQLQIRPWPGLARASRQSRITGRRSSHAAEREGERNKGRVEGFLYLYVPNGDFKFFLFILVPSNDV